MSEVIHHPEPEESGASSELEVDHGPVQAMHHQPQEVAKVHPNSRIFAPKPVEPLVMPPESDAGKLIARLENEGTKHTVFGSGEKVYVEYDGRTRIFINGVYVMSTGR